MKLTTLCAGLIGLAGIAAVPAGSDITFKPKESTTLEKEYSVSLDFALDDLKVTVNGEEMDPAMMGLDLDQATAQVEMTMAFTDEYKAMDGARPKELKRTFRSGNAKFETGSGESDDKSMDEIEGKVIVFKWNAETSAYDLTDEEGEAVEEEMQMMAEDTDLRVFLPKGSVEVDDSWSVKGKDLMTVLVPGLNFDKAMERADQEAAKEEAPFTPSDFVKFLDELGEVECTFKGTREVEGTTFQVIALKPIMEKTIDLTDTIREIADQASGGMEMTLDVKVTLEGSGNGELLWDPAAGHFHSYKLEMELRTLVNGSGGAQGAEGTMELEATTNVTYDFKAE